MKAYLLVVALAVSPACGKHNDAQILQHEAVTLAKHYRPKLDVLDQRVQAIFKRGTSIPGNIPGIEDVGRRLQEARDTIIKLRAIVSPGPDQKSAVEKQAEAAMKDNKVEELEKLVHETEVALDRGVTVINANLDTVEGWIAQYDSKTLALVTPAPQGEPPGTPEATPATGQPPAATQGAGAAPAPEQPKAPDAEPAKAPAAQPKAAEPKVPAAQPKAPAVQPKAPAVQPKAAAPAPAPAPAPKQ